MTDHRAATDQTSKTPADTTGGAGRVPLDKGGIAADKTTNATGADASSALLDGTLDPAYVKMMQGNKAAAGDSTNKPANTNPADTTARATTTAAGDKLQQNGILTNLSVHYHEPGGTSPSDKTPAVRAGAKAESVAANDANPEVKAKAQACLPSGDGGKFFAYDNGSGKRYRRCLIAKANRRQTKCCQTRSHPRRIWSGDKGGLRTVCRLAGKDFSAGYHARLENVEAASG